MSVATRLTSLEFHGFSALGWRQIFCAAVFPWNILEYLFHNIMFHIVLENLFHVFVFTESVYCNYISCFLVFGLFGSFTVIVCLDFCVFFLKKNCVALFFLAF